MSLVFAVQAKGLEGLPNKLRKFRIGIIARQSVMLKLAGQEVVGRSREDYLRGPRPGKLGRVSGDLARSTQFRISGDRVIIGSNLPYAKPHEKGFRGVVPVKAHERRVKVVFGRQRGFIVQQVRGHSMNLNIKPRPFLSTALKDAKDSIIEIINKQAGYAMKEAMR
ncbi:MAG TPA: hypothetical protein VEA41_02540 [Salinarimonas sp.]|nr:hypothetical protein [Salinarimonas sp.]